MADYSQKKFVLYVTHYSELLGANRSLLYLIEEVRSQSDYSPMVLLPFKGDLSIELEKRGIPFIVCRFRVTVYLKKRFIDIPIGWLRELYNILFASIVSVRLRKKSIELIHSNSSVLNVGAYLSIFLHKPHIWHFREFAKQHYHYNYNVGERYQYALYSKCSACIIAISKSLRDYYSVALNISNIKLIYNGVKINADSYHRYSLEGEHHIALVGIVSKNKHQDVVVEAVTKIVKEYNASNVYLHILGSSVDAVYWEMLADMISENNMGDNILMHGYCPDIYPYLSLCDIGVLASEYEAFGRVTVEYMQCGIVPVVSNSGANVELVHNGYNGLVFQLNDVNQLTDCLLKLICDPPFLRELSTQAIIDGQNYTVETNAKKIIDIYNTLLKNTCC